jgi:hypothetical protein
MLIGNQELFPELFQETTTIGNLANIVQDKFMEIAKRCYPEEFTNPNIGI